MGRVFNSDLFKSIKSGYVLFFATNLVALFLTPFILKYVTKEEYGFYILCVELFTWMGFVNLGTAKVLGPSVARELAKEDKKEVVYLFNSSFWFQLAVSVLTIPLYYGLISFAGAASSGVENYKLLIFIFALAAFIHNVSGQFSEMIIATRKIHLDNRIQLAILVLRLLLIISLIPFFGIEVIFFIYFFISLLDLTRKYYRVKKLYPDLEINSRFYSKKHFKELLSNGVFFTLASITTILVTKFDQFFLGKEVGLEIVASYYVSIKLIQIGEKFINVLFNNLRPHISRLHGNRDIESIQKIYIESSGLMMITAAVFVLVLVLINKTFVTYWVGNEMYLGDRFNAFMVLFYVLNLLTLPSRIILISTLSYVRHSAISGVFQGVLRLSLLYIGFSELDLLALPISNVVALFLFGFIYQMLLLIRFFDDLKEIKRINMTLIVLLSIGVSLSLIGISYYIPAIVALFGAIYLLKKVNYRESAIKKILTT